MHSPWTKKNCSTGQIYDTLKFFCLCIITTRIKVLLAYSYIYWSTKTTSIVFCLYFCDGNYYYTSWRQSLNEIILLDSINLQLWTNFALTVSVKDIDLTRNLIQLNFDLPKKKTKRKTVELNYGGGWLMFNVLSAIEIINFKNVCQYNMLVAYIPYIQTIIYSSSKYTYILYIINWIVNNSFS